MAKNTVTSADTTPSETEREEYLSMLECFDVCEEAKQNEKRLKTELKNARVKLALLRDSGVWGGTEYDAAQELIVRLDLALSEVWAKYDRLMYGQ